MKFKFLLLLLLLSTQTILAQLIITPGAELFVSGNAQVTLANTDLVNNGSLVAGNGAFIFSGNNTSSIQGDQSTRFFEIQINKSNNSSVLLQRNIAVTQRILFTSGFLNLNNFDTDLATTGQLDGEKEGSRITGINGGQVFFSTALNAPNAVNPGNLGAIISSDKNLGQVIIKRGHQSQAIGSGTSMLRYFDIATANNTDLDASLRFNYFDGELNGTNENLLTFFKTTDGINWSPQGFSSRNAADNYVEKTGIDSFSRWTLAASSNSLPVHFSLFNTNCDAGKVIITWKTSNEQNSSHFNIERSIDGINWTVIGNLPAAGNSNTEKNYSFTDSSPLPQSNYRITGNSLDGNLVHSNILQPSCNIADGFNVWPNPFHDIVFVNVSTAVGTDIYIKVFDARGALCKQQNTHILPGANQFSVNMKALAKGTYELSAFWNNGKNKKTILMIKQ